MQLRVRDVTTRSRYEARCDGTVVGSAAYELAGDRITFTHTEVDPGHEGRGIGGALVKVALDDARERGLAVEPQCPFVRSWIERHPAYADLVGSAAA